MPRFLLPLLYVLIFFPLGVTFCAEIWPIVMRRPVPDEFGEDLFLIALAGLLLSSFVTMLLTASKLRRPIHR